LLRELRKMTKSSVRIARVPTKILAEDLPNTSLDCYHCAILEVVIIAVRLSD
jgi:hypothetical protein